jgi:16S rRNA (guanine527-N7)-methyltransferase
VETVAGRLATLAKREEAELPSEAAEKLAAYVGLLAKWDRAINLAGFELDPPSDEALNRLIVEPVAIAIGRAGSLFERVQSALDIGSGGGSPAIPLKVLLPHVHFTLVESKARKCAFLREAIRQLDLSGITVLNCRFEDVRIGAGVTAPVDLVSVRAVRLDDQLLEAVRRVLRLHGYFLQFGSRSGGMQLPSDFGGVLTMELSVTNAEIRLARFGVD